ncbi:hypothetical protein OBBRIDRAFT_807637 [Obba rivulosa]|uniref:Uncharacterized protein n=1 Tax=Obba rivulosa TaxID=1052685 RepID=A0A8E2AIQ5_9APHY|nr:hypothetical protein OBBRIDRAFT_807637 [Obba rivulosa]
MTLLFSLLVSCSHYSPCIAHCGGSRRALEFVIAASPYHIAHSEWADGCRISSLSSKPCPTSPFPSSSAHMYVLFALLISTDVKCLFNLAITLAAISAAISLRAIIGDPSHFVADNQYMTCAYGLEVLEGIRLTHCISTSDHFVLSHLLSSSWALFKDMAQGRPVQNSNHSGPFYTVLGGRIHPQISEIPPFRGNGGCGSPIFPIIFKCNTLLEAGEIGSANDVIERVQGLSSATAISHALIASDALGDILPDQERWYCVAFGKESGVYFDINDMYAQTLGWVKPIFRREWSFKAALVYMVMKGSVPQELQFLRGVSVRTGRPQQSGIRDVPDHVEDAVAGMNSLNVSAAEHDDTTDQPHSASGRMQHPSRRQDHVSSVSRLGATATSNTRPATSTPRGMSTRSRSQMQTSTTVSSVSSVTLTSTPESDDTPLVFSPMIERRPVYHYVRDLSGILRAEYHPRIVSPAPSLGVRADTFIQAFGYTLEAIMQIKEGLTKCDSEDAFVTLLSETYGTCILEAKYL